MGIFSAFANAFKAVAAVLGFAQQRDAERNTPEMQANAAAKTDAQIANTANDAIAKGNAGDLSDERKIASE